MQSRGEPILKEIPTKLIACSILFLVYITSLGMLFYILPNTLHIGISKFYFLIYPVGVILVGVTLKYFASHYLKGELSESISNTCFIISCGIAAFFFIFFLPLGGGQRWAGFGFIILSALMALYRFSNDCIKNIIAKDLIKSGVYLVAGITLDLMFRIFLSNGGWALGFRFSAGTIFFFSLAIIAVFQLTSFLDFLGDERISKAALWFRTNHGIKFFAIFIIIYLLVYFRRYIAMGAVMGEWIFISLVLLLTFIVLAIRLSVAVNRKPEQRLRKHFQKIGLDKIRDITSISDCINGFVNDGKRNEIVATLYYMSYRTGIPLKRASTIIAPIIDYKDIKMPPLVTRSKYLFITEKNRQNRSMIIDKIVNNLQHYGGGKDYESTASPMQKHN